MFSYQLHISGGSIDYMRLPNSSNCIVCDDTLISSCAFLLHCRAFGVLVGCEKRLTQKLFRKLMHRNTREQGLQSLEDSLPDRVVHAEAYTAFNRAPMLGGYTHYSDSEQHHRNSVN